MGIFSIFTLIIFITGCASKTIQTKAAINGLNHAGKKVEIEIPHNKATVVVFLSSKCPCSNSHIGTIKDLKNKFSDVQFIGVHSNYNEDKKSAEEYFQQANLGFPIIYDDQTSIAKELGAVKTPHAFILDSKGKIIYNGSVTSSSNAVLAKENFLLIALNEIQAGKTPSEPNRKTLGCYIPLKE